MFPPHESDIAQLPYAPAAPGGAGGPQSPGEAVAPDHLSRWHVVGPLPHAMELPPAFAPPPAEAHAPAAQSPSPVAPPPVSEAVPQTAPAEPPGVKPSAAETAPAASPATPHADDAAMPPPVAHGRISSPLHEAPCWLVSMVVHLVALVLLALIPGFWNEGEKGLVTSLTFEDHSSDAVIADEEPRIDEVDLTALDVAETTIVDAADSGDVLDGMGLEDDPLASQMTSLVPPSEADAMVAAAADAVFTVADGGDLSGRGALVRGELLRAGGGTAASEEAVARALKWIVAHQAKDGGWNFDHSQGTTCDKRCGNPGSARNARNGATAMALLPLLGAGNTHKTGRYKENVDRGLRFLMLRQDDKTGSLHEPQGDMYSHGLAAIALCEAYAMTKDRALQKHAQGALRFIVTAQDPVGGGWRYAPRQPGDTSVVGWQMMALKSGLMGYLNVPPDTIRLADRFLDHVQDGDGAYYGYTDSGSDEATTSIGLLCRMYMGWRRDHPALVRGVEYLGKTGPSSRNMYYNYYATQVMHHYGGEPWRAWNAEMRDSLVNRQEKSGHAAGSWLVGDRFVGQGGRLYCTALGAMILEVYYRHLPIYRQQSIEERFRGAD